MAAQDDTYHTYIRRSTRVPPSLPPRMHGNDIMWKLAGDLKIWRAQPGNSNYLGLFNRKLTKCGHLEDKTLAVVSLILSLL